MSVHSSGTCPSGANSRVPLSILVTSGPKRNIPYGEDLNLLGPSTKPYNSARRPYPLFNSATLTQTGGSSIYHGLTVQADRKMAKGLWFNVNYTWAKALTDANFRDFGTAAQQNQYPRFLERADDPNVRRQQLRFSYIYELPFGRGKRAEESSRGPDCWSGAGRFPASLRCSLARA